MHLERRCILQQAQAVLEQITASSRKRSVGVSEGFFFSTVKFPLGERVLLFGDLKNYWIADRQNRTFRRLNELYARTDQVGFMTTQRVDGRLILPESVKVLLLRQQIWNCATFLYSIRL